MCEAWLIVYVYSAFLKDHSEFFLTTWFYFGSWLFVFIILTIISISYDSIVLSKVISEIWECIKKRNQSKNSQSSQMIKQVETKPIDTDYLSHFKVTNNHYLHRKLCAHINGKYSRLQEVKFKPRD